MISIIFLFCLIGVLGTTETVPFDHSIVWRETITLLNGKRGVVILTEHRDARKRASLNHSFRFAEPLEAWWVNVPDDMTDEEATVEFRRLGYVPRLQYGPIMYAACALEDSIAVMGIVYTDAGKAVSIIELSLTGMSIDEERAFLEKKRHESRRALHEIAIDTESGSEVIRLPLDLNRPDLVMQDYNMLGGHVVIVSLCRGEANRLQALIRTGGSHFVLQQGGPADNAWKILAPRPQP